MPALAFVTEDFPTDGTVAVNFYTHTNEAMHGLGQTCRGTSNTDWIYVKVTAALAAGACAVNATTFVAGAGTGYTAPVAFTTAQPFGWVRATAGAV